MNRFGSETEDTMGVLGHCCSSSNLIIHHFSPIQTSLLAVTDQLCAFSSLLYTLLESLPFYRAVLLREAEGEKNDEVGLSVRGRSRVLIWFGLGQLASLPRSSHFISNVPFSSVCNRK